MEKIFLSNRPPNWTLQTLQSARDGVGERGERLEGSRERSCVSASRSLHLKSEADNGLDCVAHLGIDNNCGLVEHART